MRVLFLSLCLSVSGSHQLWMICFLFFFSFHFTKPGGLVRRQEEKETLAHRQLNLYPVEVRGKVNFIHKTLACQSCKGVSYVQGPIAFGFVVFLTTLINVMQRRPINELM